MYRLEVTFRANSRVRLAKLYILIREVIDYFGLEDDVSVELDAE